MSTALLVIDAQKIYTERDSEMYCADATLVLRRVNDLIDAFVATEQPIIYVRHMHNADGSDTGRLFDFAGEAEEEFNFVEGTEEVEYSEGLTMSPGHVEVIKNRYSAFSGTDLDAQLRRLGVGRIAICGFMTNFCCESTARCALDRDYYIDFVIDATSTPGTDNMDAKEIRRVVAELLGAGFARIYKTKRYVESLRAT